ncbi:copper resistance protein CopZ [Psychrobacillus glaciei]|uniref:Copper chaperone CopZ n=1 Tax=Psychrobacillus glaciei TaxID=2283160 RepID=A0A5J6SIR0_9BACI|nr:copper chaperone CopZ [Psychrobacillus glaciei]QFF97860.1 copper resistance protein CopZ [Psychrobacillus glaciei]
MVSQVTLNVQGMSCGHCVNAVESNVGKLDGVEQVNVHLETGKVDVSFDEEKITVEKIKETIDDQGYEVK